MEKNRLNFLDLSLKLVEDTIIIDWYQKDSFRQIFVLFF